MDEEILVFDVAGDWGHFKRPYTTTSPLTFDLPSPPTLMGLIGAILGLDRRGGKYLRELIKADCRFSVTLKASPRKLKTGLKFLHTKNTWRGVHKTPHALIETELLCEPTFRVFCKIGKAELRTELKKRLVEHRPYYVPALGLAWCLADVEWVGSYPVKPIQTEEKIEVLGWLPQQAIDQPIVESGKRYHMMTLPVKMEPSRRSRYKDVVYEHSGKTICCSLRPGETVWEIQHGGEIASPEVSYVYLL